MLICICGCVVVAIYIFGLAHLTGTIYRGQVSAVIKFKEIHNSQCSTCSALNSDGNLIKKCQCRAIPEFNRILTTLRVTIVLIEFAN